MRNRGLIDPHSINEYIAVCQGYSGLARALALSPQDVIAELRQTGLRGRGGVGRPTALKWQACYEASGGEKYAVCNAVDADPRARTARLLMGGDPHAVLEGLLIGAYAVGAAHCFVCINADYREEIAIVEDALSQMRRSGLLGEDVLESGFSCDIAIKEITGSLVSGEETALIRALENRQPLPDLRGDYLTVNGLRGLPTLVDSAETLANISAIFQEHPAALAGGVDGRGGTKIVTLSGPLSHESTVEVPLGMTIGALIEEVEGAPLDDLDIKAVQLGGPTGAFFAGDSLNTPITFEDLEATGSVMGSATVRVFGRGACAVEMARDVMADLRDGSCGKCVACREGTYQLADMLDDLVEYRGKSEDMELLLELCEAMRNGSICGLGRTAGAPLLSSMKLFAADYRAHIDDKRCPEKA